MPWIVWKTWLTCHILKLYIIVLYIHTCLMELFCGVVRTSYLNYIRICQKKAVRCIFKSSYNSHTDPLFQKGGILKFDDLYTLEIGKFVFDGLHNILPNRLSQSMQSNMTIHDHVTRPHHNPHVHLSRTVVAKNSLQHRAPRVWSQFPLNIRESDTRNKFKCRLTKMLLVKY